MQEFLIFIYIVINIIIVVWYLSKRKIGVFAPPFLVASISLSVMLPQLTTIYFHPYYDKNLLYNLCYIMITCNLALFIGFEKGCRRNLPSKIKEINIEKTKHLVFFFSLLGIGSLVTTGDGVIQANFRRFSEFAIIFSLVYFIKAKKPSIIFIISFLIGTYIIVNYAFFIYGSRGYSLFLFIAIAYCCSLKFPKLRKCITILMVLFLLVGSIISASIGAFRENLVGQSGKKVDYYENFINSFKDSYTDVGMDLGNGAILIDYCVRNNSYNYGTIVWNGFVYNYIPERFLGKGIKNELQYNAEYEKLIPLVTNNITTVTGYFEAFATWGYLGFFIFGIIGYLLGVIWERAFYSNFYKLLLIYSLGNVPLMITHNLQYLFARWEMLLIFIFPICYMYIYEKRRKYYIKQISIQI